MTRFPSRRITAPSVQRHLRIPVRQIGRQRPGVPASARSPPARFWPRAGAPAGAAAPARPPPWPAPLPAGAAPAAAPAPPAAPPGKSAPATIHTRVVTPTGGEERDQTVLQQCHPKSPRDSVCSRGRFGVPGRRVSGVRPHVDAGAAADGDSWRNAPPIFFSSLARKENGAVHGTKEKAAWTRSACSAPSAADGGSAYRCLLRFCLAFGHA